jgi:glycosyltransferase involved in cell wall biosynthesis
LVKLLYIATNLNTSGGVARVLAVKLNYLVQNYDYDIFIINTNGNTDKLFFKFDERISIESLNQDDSKLKQVLTYHNKLNKKIKGINPDIIINCDNGLKGALLPFIYSGKAPLIFESHSSINASDSSIIGNLKLKLKNLFFLKSVKRYNKIVVYKHLSKAWKTNNIRVIHNPLGFKIPEQSTLFNNKVVIAVGRISFQKGYDNLLDIWALVFKKHPDWKLHIYGEGDRRKLMSRIGELGLSESIIFFEPVLNIRDVYLNASILVNSSRFEPFGLALIEAMACGLPVLAFKNAIGPTIYIKQAENGFLIEKDNINDYANQIIALIDDKSEMKRVGENAKKSMNAYRIESIMETWHQLFQSV